MEWECHLDIQVTDTHTAHPITGVGDMVDTTIPGVLTDIMEEALTGRDTTMATTMAITTGTTDMLPLTDTVTWIAETITDMAQPQTPPTTDPRELTITIPDTGAERPIPRVPALPHRGMALVVLPAQLSEVLQRAPAVQLSVMQGPYPHPLPTPSVLPQEPMQR